CQPPRSGVGQSVTGHRFLPTPTAARAPWLPTASSNRSRVPPARTYHSTLPFAQRPLNELVHQAPVGRGHRPERIFLLEPLCGEGRGALLKVDENRGVTELAVLAMEWKDPKNQG